MKKLTLIFASAMLLLAFGPLQAQLDPMSPLPLDESVRYGVLENGMTYYIKANQEPRERASFYIIQNVGALLEEDHQNGLAHFLEHMAFKGTKTVGTTDYEPEATLRDELDRIFDELVKEKAGASPDSARIAELDTLFEQTRRKADEYIVNNEFIDMMRREGGSGVNAYTSNDATQIPSVSLFSIHTWTVN